MKRVISHAAAGILAVGLLLLLPDLLYRNPPLPPGTRADVILVVKSQKTLYLLDGDKVVQSYRVALGKAKGPKSRQGDKRTPEGKYENCQPNRATKFYKAIYVNYPNSEERKRGFSGSAVEIHGLPPLAYNLERYLGSWIILLGWTEGCVMLTNQDMDEIVGTVRFPVQVEIRPDLPPGSRFGKASNS